MVAHPIRNSGSAPPKNPGPELGGDTDGLLAELGYSADQVAALRKAGAVG